MRQIQGALPRSLLSPDCTEMAQRSFRMTKSHSRLLERVGAPAVVSCRPARVHQGGPQAEVFVGANTWTFCFTAVWSSVSFTRPSQAVAAADTLGGTSVLDQGQMHGRSCCFRLGPTQCECLRMGHQSGPAAWVLCPVLVAMDEVWLCRKRCRHRAASCCRHASACAYPPPRKRRPDTRRSRMPRVRCSRPSKPPAPMQASPGCPAKACWAS